MAPMIDVVFQLLIFFMLTLKIIEPEGDFNINMPIGAPAKQQPDDMTPPDIKVRLRANPDGQLAAVEFSRRNLGNDPQVFRRLNAEILSVIGKPGSPWAKATEVEIDADYNLHYGYVIQAVGACTGRLDPRSKQIIRYVETIKFAAPRRPTEAG